VQNQQESATVRLPPNHPIVLYLKDHCHLVMKGNKLRFYVTPKLARASSVWQRNFWPGDNVGELALVLAVIDSGEGILAAFSASIRLGGQKAGLALIHKWAEQAQNIVNARP
jgi:hypothetical protein